MEPTDKPADNAVKSANSNIFDDGVYEGDDSRMGDVGTTSPAPDREEVETVWDEDSTDDDFNDDDYRNAKDFNGTQDQLDAFMATVTPTYLLTLEE